MLQYEKLIGNIEHRIRLINKRKRQRRNRSLVEIRGSTPESYSGFGNGDMQYQRESFKDKSAKVYNPAFDSKQTTMEFYDEYINDRSVNLEYLRPTDYVNMNPQELVKTVQPAVLDYVKQYILDFKKTFMSEVHSHIGRALASNLIAPKYVGSTGDTSKEAYSGCRCNFPEVASKISRLEVVVVA